MDKLILVLYVDVGDLEESDMGPHIEMVTRALFPEEVTTRLNATTFTIPRVGGGTVIECINPKFIVDADVYRDFRLKMDVLSEHVDHFIQAKKEK